MMLGGSVRVMTDNHRHAHRMPDSVRRPSANSTVARESCVAKAFSTKDLLQKDASFCWWQFRPALLLC